MLGTLLARRLATLSLLVVDTDHHVRLGAARIADARRWSMSHLPGITCQMGLTSSTTLFSRHYKIEIVEKTIDDLQKYNEDQKPSIKSIK